MDDKAPLSTETPDASPTQGSAPETVELATDVPRGEPADAPNDGNDTPNGGM